MVEIRITVQVMKRGRGKLAEWAYVLVLAWAAIHHAAADSVVSNSGFEDGTTGWQIFVPDESKNKNAQFDVVSTAPHAGNNCARFQSDDLARYGIGAGFMPVQAGDRYRVSVWIKADASAQVRPKTPGFVIRLYLKQGSADAPGGHLFICYGNTVSRNTPPPVTDPVTLPSSWTKIEAVVEIPEGVDTIGPALFCWWTQGVVYADDFSLEKVDASTAVTPVYQPATK
jgi:hypothetical protein